MCREKKLTCLSRVRVSSDGPADGEHVFHRHGADDAGDLRLALSAVPAKLVGSELARGGVVPHVVGADDEGPSVLVNIHTFILERSVCSVPHPCALSALKLFFSDFSAARPRFVARLARSDGPQSRGPCPRTDPPSPRPSRSASEVARSRLRGLPHAPQSQPCFFTTTSLLGSSYSPAVTLFVFGLFLVLDRHGLGAAAAAACCCYCPQHQY